MFSLPKFYIFQISYQSLSTTS